MEDPPPSVVRTRYPDGLGLTFLDLDAVNLSFTNACQWSNTRLCGLCLSLAVFTSAFGDLLLYGNA